MKSFFRQYLKDITLKDCLFENPTLTDLYSADDNLSLLVTRADGFTVENCEFIRDENHVGKGVHFWQTHNSKIINSVFDGFFFTFINIYGALKDSDSNFPREYRTFNTLIENNLIENGCVLLSNGTFGEGFMILNNQAKDFIYNDTSPVTVNNKIF
ncbi:MAG: hypothetical protein ABIA04_14800 [Pseudomonadota bacterium]